MIRNYLLAFYIVTVISAGNSMAGNVEVTRLNNNEPVISINTFIAVGKASDGYSINGPSVVRVPEWVTEKADPNANYYCYFGDHSGSYIRMAWAESIEGPWTLFNLGSNDTVHPGRGVLDDSGTAIKFINGKQIDNNHISSPDVIIDNHNQRFLLFFHAGNSSDNSLDGDRWFDTGGQVTFVATSGTGLNFNGGDEVSSGGVGPGEPGHGIRPTVLGNAYFRTFEYKNRYYAFTNYGPIWAGPENGEPWSSCWNHVRWSSGVLTGGGNPIWEDLYSNWNAVGISSPRHYAGYGGTSSASPYGENAPRTGAPRHFATRMLADGKTLEVYYTSRGEKPERVFRTTMDLSQGDYTSWDTMNYGTPDVHQEIIRPEETWEGVNHPFSISKNGAETDVNALRDPYVFVDSDGKSYLFYAGNPESAIGVASINNLPDVSFTQSSNSVMEGESVSVIASAMDTDGYISEYHWDWGDNTTSIGETQNHTYSAAGTYTIRLTITDNVGSESAVTRTVNVTTLANEPPVITQGKNISVTMSQDANPTPFSLTLDATDSNSDTITWKISSQASHGSATVSGTGDSKTVGYVPDTGYNGTDSFRVKVTDGNGGNDTITVTVVIEPAATDIGNKIPVVAVTASDNDGNLPLNVVDTDLDTRWSSNVDGAELTLQLDDVYLTKALKIAFFNGGSRQAYFDLNVSVDGRNWTSLGSNTSSGTSAELETYEISETDAVFVSFTGHGNSTNDWNSITEIEIYGDLVGGISNVAPVAVKDNFTTNQNTPLAIDAPGVLDNDTDAGSAPLTATLVSGPANGTVTLYSDGSFLYSPDSGFIGTDSFTYTAYDGELESIAATATITVNDTGNNDDDNEINEDNNTNIDLSDYDVLFEDDFEGNDFSAKGWKLVGNGELTANAFQGNFCARIKKGGDLEKNLSTEGYGQILLQYARTTVGLAGSEDLRVEWSIDGIQWNKIEKTQSVAWKVKSVELPTEADDNSDFRFRFNVTSDRLAERGLIDNVIIHGKPTGTPGDEGNQDGDNSGSDTNENTDGNNNTEEITNEVNTDKSSGGGGCFIGSASNTFGL